MKSVALIALGVAGVGAGLYFFVKKGSLGSGAAAAGPAGIAGLSEDGDAVNVQAGSAIPAKSPADFSQKAANILANKTGTDLICKGISTYYTAGAGNGACGTVAAIANKVTQLQVRATVAVANKVASAAAPAVRTVGSAVKTSVVVPTRAAVSVAKASVTVPVKAVSKVTNFVGGLF
jgi:hypothetical protein